MKQLLNDLSKIDDPKLFRSLLRKYKIKGKWFVKAKTKMVY